MPALSVQSPTIVGACVGRIVDHVGGSSVGTAATNMAATSMMCAVRRMVMDTPAVSFQLVGSLVSPTLHASKEGAAEEVTGN